MFIRIGCTYQLHRAHLVRGILESHGIPAVVWHEAPLYHEFAPGWLGCDVMVHEEDHEDACTILQARPLEDEPESAGEETSSWREDHDLSAGWQRFPGFRDWLVTGVIVLAAGLAISLPLTLLESAIASSETSTGYARYTDTGIRPETLLGLVLSPLVFALLAPVIMAPYTIWRDDPWMGLLAWLYIRALCMSPMLLYAFIKVWKSSSA